MVDDQRRRVIKKLVIIVLTIMATPVIFFLIGTVGKVLVGEPINRDGIARHERAQIYAELEKNTHVKEHVGHIEFIKVIPKEEMQEGFLYGRARGDKGDAVFFLTCDWDMDTDQWRVQNASMRLPTGEWFDIIP